MSDRRPTVVCEGRAVDHDTGQSVGNPCGRLFRGTLEQAWCRGWSVTGPPMCPACRRPDPEIARMLAARPAADVPLF